MNILPTCHLRAPKSKSRDGTSYGSSATQIYGVKKHTGVFVPLNTGHGGSLGPQMSYFSKATKFKVHCVISVHLRSVYHHRNLGFTKSMDEPMAWI